MKIFRLLRQAVLAAVIFSLPPVLEASFDAAGPGEQDHESFPLGPLGATASGYGSKNTLRILALQSGAPAAKAGLKVDDLICGAFGSPFSLADADSLLGPRMEFGLAIERAEGGDGSLPLLVQRPGVGQITVSVQLPAAGRFGPAYPLGSAKYDALYETSCAKIHAKVMADAKVDYFQHSWAGLVLLGHPNWSQSTGASPYRLSIDKIKAAIVAYLPTLQYAPQEATLSDGSANPSYNADNLGSNWALGSIAIFLGEYYSKTKDAAVLPSVQLVAELIANRVQWWQQPKIDPTSTYTPAIAGVVGHNGVSGDYVQHGWYVGINIVGAHMASGLAICKRAGANFGIRPADGHGACLTPGWNGVNYSLDDKYNMLWN